MKIPVILDTGYIFGPSVVCPGKQYIYNLPQWPTTMFNWTIVSSTGATIAHTDQNNEIAVTTHGSGTITLKCNYSNTLLGCGGLAYKTITVGSAVSVSGNTKACTNTSQTYTLSSGTGDWTLQWPNGTTTTSTGTSGYSPTFTVAGTYILSVSGNFCAPDPMTITVRPKPATPDSLLGPGNACPGFPTPYTTKFAHAGSVFAWSAAAGSVSPTSGPSTYATFTGSGPWVVKVWREDVAGPTLRF